MNQPVIFKDDADLLVIARALAREVGPIIASRLAVKCKKEGVGLAGFIEEAVQRIRQTQVFSLEDL